MRNSKADARNVELHIIEQPPGDLFDAADEYIAAMGEPFHSPNMLAKLRACVS